ncbi:PepSY-associated TM helix domain-containing protein [Methylomicrobium album]|uniref:Putative iron-regulated membrane protein n=1 Tax=Methylomicrobium album BG8 TaxID=686340 RepID=H8GM66_METAL|nr:PepSY-associated TM helix domain-containing protein [Methylomicrobium album]EIC29427.1 putative iron-regulated membrane protein [Methylomicrobium album BG8]
MSLDISPFKHLASLQSLSALKRRRHYWLTVHLWLGLALGALLSIYGVTGGILVFHVEINEWLNADTLTVTPPRGKAVYRPLPEIFKAGRTVMPDAAKLTFATYPRNDEAAFIQSYSLAKPDGAVENWQVCVDPYTARVTGKHLMGDSESWLPNTFIGFVFKLHYALLLPNDVSQVVVGVSGALLVISTLTGLIVWWPLTGKWRQALGFKAGAGPVRFNYDLHKTSGFYTALVMIPVLFSGVYMVLPHNVVPVLELFSPVTYRYWFRSTPVSGKESLNMAEAIARADRLYPKGRPHWIYGIYGADEATAAYTVCKDNVDRPGSWLQRVCVVMDRYSGDYLDIDDPATGTAGEVFTHWQWPLHSGQAFGMAGRILVFLTGLACPVLFVTGFIRWRQKQRARQKAG